MSSSSTPRVTSSFTIKTRRAQLISKNAELKAEAEKARCEIAKLDPEMVKKLSMKARDPSPFTIKSRVQHQAIKSGDFPASEMVKWSSIKPNDLIATKQEMVDMISSEKASKKLVDQLHETNQNQLEMLEETLQELTNVTLDRDETNQKQLVLIETTNKELTRISQERNNALAHNEELVQELIALHQQKQQCENYRKIQQEYEDLLYKSEFQVEFQVAKINELTEERDVLLDSQLVDEKHIQNLNEESVELIKQVNALKKETANIPGQVRMWITNVFALIGFMSLIITMFN